MSSIDSDDATAPEVTVVPWDAWGPGNAMLTMVPHVSQRSTGLHNVYGMHALGKPHVICDRGVLRIADYHQQRVARERALRKAMMVAGKTTATMAMTSAVMVTGTMATVMMIAIPWAKDDDEGSTVTRWRCGWRRAAADPLRGKGYTAPGWSTPRARPMRSRRRRGFLDPGGVVPSAIDHTIRESATRD
jgi:hypothetical protein